MSHAKKKLQWCINKAKKELESDQKHKGIIEINPSKEEAIKHIKKSKHYLKATLKLKETGFSDLCASSLFYAMYHSLLGIIMKFGYESRNQTCTFAVIEALIEDKKIDFDLGMLKKIASSSADNETSSINIREKYQYGTELELDTNVYKNLFELAKEVTEKAETIIESD